MNDDLAEALTQWARVTKGRKDLQDQFDQILRDEREARERLLRLIGED